MSVPKPHFLLYSEARAAANRRGWQFVLQTESGATALAVKEREAESSAERLELLAVIRGLEAVDGPADVTLCTTSKYVLRGVEFGLDEWRENDWQWERHGEWTPIKHRDLWQRLDRAMSVHNVRLQRRRLDPKHATPAVADRAEWIRPTPQPVRTSRLAGTRPANSSVNSGPLPHSARRRRRRWLGVGRKLSHWTQILKVGVRQLAGRCLPAPWFD